VVGDSDIQKLRRTGKRTLTTHFDVRASESLFSHGRVGVIVPKFGKTIVERNRLRRQLREIARLIVLPEVAGRDVLIKALPSAYGSAFSSLSEELSGVARMIARSAQ
jgi:ribonuclease P protein component